MTYVAMMKSESRYWLLMILNPDEKVYQVRGWDSEHEAIASFEKMYQDAAGIHGANSTTISWIFARPCIIGVEEKDLESIVVSEPILTSVSWLGSHFMGVEIRPDMSDKLWTTGKEPRLSHEST